MRFGPLLVEKNRHRRQTTKKATRLEIKKPLSIAEPSSPFPKESVVSLREGGGRGRRIEQTTDRGQSGTRR
jgi:hypothetical protein